MKQITCHECGRRYNFEKDDFCPRCGAFTPPAKLWDVDSHGNVVRVDGINEKDHAGSFVHQEAHKEKAVRKVKGLDRDQIPAHRKAAQEAKQLLKVMEVMGVNGEKPQNTKALFGIIFAVFWALLTLILELIG